MMRHMVRARILDVLYKLEILLLVTLPLCAVVVAVVYWWNSYVFATDMILFSVMFLIAMFGSTIGYHRYLTHQGFVCGPVLKALLVIAGCTAFEGRPLDWVPTHIKHHAYSDEDDDPHSPLHGFFHAHVGWIFNPRSFAHPKEYAPHLLQDPVILWADHLYLLWMALSLAIPFALGGWTALVWAGGVRIFLNTHITYSVNSVCHTFGKRAFLTTDESRNEWVVGLLAFGEGWHNNHHAFPRNAFHGMRWWQFDLSGLVIRGLEKTGLVWDVQRVSVEVQEAQKNRAQSMWSALQELRQSALSSIAAARTQWTESAATYMQSVSESQLDQWQEIQMDSVKRLDDMQAAIARSAHLKRAKLLQYQREAERLMNDVKRRYGAVTGSMASA